MFDHVPENNVSYLYIEPGETQRRHYHKLGADIFMITDGTGLLHWGKVDPDTDQLIEGEVIPVKEGDVYFVDPCHLHSLENTGLTTLRWVNIAPGNHGNEDQFEVIG